MYVKFHYRASVCLSVCLSVCPGIMLSFLHASLSDFTYSLIPILGRFLNAFQLPLPVLIRAVTLKLIQATLPLFQFPLFQQHCFITSPFHCGKLEILSRTAQTTAALTRLKPVGIDKSISLSSKIRLMHSLVTSIFLYACESWTLTA